MNATNTARRDLLRFLAARPLVAAPSVTSSIAKYLTPATRPAQALGTEFGRKYDLAD